MAAPPPIITLTTDFGARDAYVGVMKGVILGINPRAAIVDLSHEVEPQAIAQGAFIIGSSHRFFPSGTIHVVVVDPGVGTSRKAVLLVTPTGRFLGPDNGVLTHVAGPGYVDGEGLAPGYEAYELSNRELWLGPPSDTFHGRDVFAPGGGPSLAGRARPGSRSAAVRAHPAAPGRRPPGTARCWRAAWSTWTGTGTWSPTFPRACCAAQGSWWSR